MNKEIMCVLCPNSCCLKVEYNEHTKEIVSLSGNKCKRGRGFAEQEITNPLRTLTYSIIVEGGTLPLVSTRSKEPIPFCEIIKTAEQLRKIRLAAPIKSGDVIFENDICTIIATKNIPKSK